MNSKDISEEINTNMHVMKRSFWLVEGINKHFVTKIADRRVKDGAKALQLFSQRLKKVVVINQVDFWSHKAKQNDTQSKICFSFIKWDFMHLALVAK